MRRFIPSPAAFIAMLALVLSITGGAEAAGVFHLGPNSVHTRNIHKYAVTQSKLAPSVQRELAVHSTVGKVGSQGPQGATGPAGSQGPAGVAGPAGAVGPAGPQGPKGDTGATGPAGAQGPAGTPILFESQESCTPDLCIDAAPGPQGLAGSSGWGWDNSANKPVTNLAVGSTHSLVVTALQDNPHANGSITVTYDPYDFSYVGNGDSSATCVKDASLPGEMSCTYTDLAHSAKGDSFSFKALNDNPEAVVTATVDINGEQASASFPVAITG